MFVETCVAPVNIAIVKYWGKRDENLILPINDSLSITLNTDELCAQTTAAASASFKRNVMWLNGEEVPFDSNERVMRCLKELQQLALAKGDLKFPIDWKLQIASKNNFPTAAGLASSAAGYACLVYTLATLYGVETEELTAIARQGSGSACRSLHGGFVRWLMGVRNDGRDSVAIPVAPATHWSDMHVLILVVNDSRKSISSTNGMRRSVETSDLITYRAQHCVPKRMEVITQAIKERNFEKFAEIMMKDSNQFHAIALDTYPPCIYMNDVSHSVIHFVHAFNEAAGSTKVSYTFDAGSNPCLFLLEKDVNTVYSALMEAFPNDASADVEYVKGIPLEYSKNFELNGNVLFKTNGRNQFKYIIHSRIGAGPKKLDKEASLLSLTDGMPNGNFH